MDVLFQTGSDEHGQKIAEAAEEKRMAPHASSTDTPTCFGELTQIGRVERCVQPNDE